MTTKSGLIVGMGETTTKPARSCVTSVPVECDISDHWPISPTDQRASRHRAVYHPDEFAALKEEGLALGFRARWNLACWFASSYHADTTSVRTLKDLRLFLCPQTAQPSNRIEQSAISFVSCPYS